MKTKVVKNKLLKHHVKFVRLNFIGVSILNMQVGHLTSVGGSSVDNMGSRILKYIVAKPLAEKYNWTGTKGKAAFEKPKIPSLLKSKLPCNRTCTYF